MRSWGWVGQYAIAILLALLLGAALGSMPLFKETVLVTKKLKASDVAEFMGYGGALLLFWLLARRAATQVPTDPNGVSFLRYVIPPLATLMVVSASYSVLLVVGGPFLTKTGKTIYNWVFIVGIITAAVWLILAWLRHAAPAMESLETLGEVGRNPQPSTTLSCPHCQAPVVGHTTFCGRCGVRVAGV